MGLRPHRTPISVRWIAFWGSPLRLAPKEQAGACLAEGGCAPTLSWRRVLPLDVILASNGGKGAGRGRGAS